MWSWMQPRLLLQALEHWLKLSVTRKGTWLLNEFCTTDGPQPLWGYWKHLFCPLTTLGLLHKQCVTTIIVSVRDTSGLFSTYPISAGDLGASMCAVHPSKLLGEEGRGLLAIKAVKHNGYGLLMSVAAASGSLKSCHQISWKVNVLCVDGQCYEYKWMASPWKGSSRTVWCQRSDGLNVTGNYSFYIHIKAWKTGG